MRWAAPLLLGAALLALGACAPGQGGLRFGAAPAPSPTPRPPTKEEVRALVDRYFAAYHAGDLDAVAALLADDVAIADCDYGVGARARAEGKPQVIGFIQQRLAQHDLFEIERIAVNEEATGASIVYKRRTNDALAARGIAEDGTLAGSVILFRGHQMVQINTGSVQHCNDIVRR